MRNFKKIFLCVVLFLGLGVGIKGFAFEDEFKDRDTTDSVQRVVLIDPGHGGVDGGAISRNGLVEKEINLDIAKKLHEELEGRGYEVYLTRDADNSLATKKKDDLYLRCKKKEEVKCKVFISIHQNKFPKGNCKGTQIWYASNEKSKCIAEQIQGKIKENIQKENKRVPKDAKKAYRILRDGNSEANIIVECGFLSNAEDEKNMKDDKYKKEFVSAIGDGIDEYFKKGF